MASTTTLPKQPPTQQTARLRIIKGFAIALIVLLALGALGGKSCWRLYKKIRQERAMVQARQFVEKKDYKQAVLALSRALQVNPRDVEANRMMANISEGVGSPQSMLWLRAVSDLEPNVLQNHLKLADAAIRYNSPGMSEIALGKISEADKKTLAYHDIAARTALAFDRPAKAEFHFAQALKLAPDNADYKLGLASVQIASRDPETHARARDMAAELAKDPTLHRAASRLLVDDMIKSRDYDKALVELRTLQAAPDAKFEDKMLYLTFLGQLKQPEFHAVLLDVEDQALGDINDATTLMTWLNENAMAMVGVDWSRRLPDAMRARLPLAAAIADCHLKLKNWEELKALVSDADWEHLEFARLAFLARVQREQGEVNDSKNQWNNAVRAAADRTEATAMLAHYATLWGWEAEANDVLWSVAKGGTNQQWALRALQRIYTAGGNTRGLLNVATRMLDLDSQDYIAQNNVAQLSLLLNTNMAGAQAIVRAVYGKHQENPAVASTMAFALHMQGQTDAGLEILRKVDAKLLHTDPGYAAYLAILLASSGPGSSVEALAALETAERGKLLPEERELIAQARKKVREAGKDAR